MCIDLINMPINVFCKSSKNSEKRNDTSVFVQRPYLRSNYKENNIEEDIVLQSQFRIKNLPCPQKNSVAVCKCYVDSGLNDPSIIQNIAHVDFNDKSFDNVHFVKVFSLPAVRERLTPNFYVESSLLRLDPGEKLKRDEQDSLTPKSTLRSRKTITE